MRSPGVQPLVNAGKFGIRRSNGVRFHAPAQLTALPCWSEEIVTYVLCDFAADLIAMTHRVPPVKPRPNARVVYISGNRIQVIVRTLGLDQLRDSRFARHDGPCYPIRTEEPCDCIGQSRGPEPMRGGVLWMVYRQ